MRVRYTFTSELEDVAEMLYQKYNRIYGRNDLNEYHSKLKSDLINKESLKHIEKLLTNYKDALISVLQEVEENRDFLESLLYTLNDVSDKEVVEEEEKVVDAGEQPENSIESLANIVDSLTNKVRDDEQTQSV